MVGSWRRFSSLTTDLSSRTLQRNTHTRRAQYLREGARDTPRATGSSRGSGFDSGTRSPNGTFKKQDRGGRDSVATACPDAQLEITNLRLGF